MSRWFRVYDELLDDPKVQRLHPALFKVLVNLWCVASRHDGRLPSIQNLSFSLRMSEDETFRAVSKLSEAGFIDTDSDTNEQRPHGWEARQFRSDVSTDRVRAHRDRQKSAKNGKRPHKSNGSGGNGHETFHETPPDTETDTEYSEAKASGAAAPIMPADFTKAVFDGGLALLESTGDSERNRRSFLGRLRQQLGDDAAMLVILRQAQVEQPCDAKAWLTAAVETRNGKRKPSSFGAYQPSAAVALFRESIDELAADRSYDEASDFGTWPAISTH